jgi:hypothetical protein
MWNIIKLRIIKIKELLGGNKMIVREYEDNNIRMLLVKTKRGFEKQVESKITGNKELDIYPDRKTANEYFNDLMNLSKIYSTFDKE